VPLADGTMVVCFLDDRPSVEMDRPRVLVWRHDRPLEEVGLSEASRRMLAVLATPDLDLPGGLWTERSAERVAAALAAPLPQRAAAELRARLGYSKSHEWRVRRKLADELDACGLAAHLVSEARGCIGLRSATSDVAALHGALRDGRSEDAMLLLRGIATERPDLLVLIAPSTWPSALGTAIEHALAQGLAGLRDRVPTDDASNAHDREAVDAEIVEDPTDEGIGTAAVGQPLALSPRGTAPFAPDSHELPLPRLPRRVWRQRVWGRRLRRAAGPALVLLAMGALGLVAGRSYDRVHTELSAARAGRWPTGAQEAIANLTKRIPFDPATVPAHLGDVLLYRYRFRLAAQPPPSQAGRPVILSLTPRRDLADSVLISLMRSVPGPNSSGGFTSVTGVTLRQRLRAVPGTAQLLDVDGRIMRKLPDLTDGHQIVIYGLRPGHVYAVQTRYVVVAIDPSTRGAFRSTGAECRGPGVADPYASYADRSLLVCTASLSNWGPRSLREVRIRLPVERNPIDLRPMSRQVVLDGTASSADADPPEAPIYGAIVTLDRRSSWTVDYVRGSARVRYPGGRIQRLAGDPLGAGVVLPELPVDPPEPAILGELRRAPTLQFRIRLRDVLRR
jgi:hypothetical protein